MINGSNAGKGDAFAAPRTDDSDFIGFDGMYVKGYQQIDSFHQMLFDIVKGSRLIGEIRSICFVTEDVAIEIAVGRTIMTGRWDIDPDRNSSHTLVAVKRNLKLHFYRFSKFASTIHWKTRGIPCVDRRTKTRAMVGI